MIINRKKMGFTIAVVLYGVIAILPAALLVDPGEKTHTELALGAVILGISAILTYFFKEIVQSEGNLARNLSVSEYVRTFLHCLPVLAFPVLVVFIGLLCSLLSVGEAQMLRAVFVAGVFTISAIGFCSTYLIHRSITKSLARAFVWAALCALMLAFKYLVD